MSFVVPYIVVVFVNRNKSVRVDDWQAELTIIAPNQVLLVILSL